MRETLNVKREGTMGSRLKTGDVAPNIQVVNADGSSKESAWVERDFSRRVESS
jgi:hypothetical protein